MIKKLPRHHKLAATALCIVLVACGCSTERATPSPSPQTPEVRQTALPAQALSSILAILLSEDTPLVNLRHYAGTEIQVALPAASGDVPKRIGKVSLRPVDKSRAGLVLEIELLSVSQDEVWVRADAAFFDPEQGFAVDGAEWRELIFRRGVDEWYLHKALNGAIK